MKKKGTGRFNLSVPFLAAGKQLLISDILLAYHIKFDNGCVDIFVGKNERGVVGAVIDAP